MSRPGSPQLAQQRMLREVLLKAVENLRRNQRRYNEPQGEQELEELQLQTQSQEINSLNGEKLQTDTATSRGQQLHDSTKLTQNKEISDQIVQGKLSNKTFIRHVR